MGYLTPRNTSLSGLKVIEKEPVEDERGFLLRLFCAKELDTAGWTKSTPQVNWSLTKLKGAVRGLHFQMPPQPEMKIVPCIRGAVWDVQVDLRKRSPTFLHWHSTELSASNRLSILIPEGLAHGFQALTDNVELVYCHSGTYESSAEGGLNPQDPRLAIPWPLKISQVSVKDHQQKFLEPDYQGIDL